MKAVVSIAGSDSSGGAGIQADIKTIQALGLYAETVITALTAQNTLGVTSVRDIDSEFITDQMDAVFSDICPSAVKIGMVSSASTISAIVKGLDKWNVAPVVVDPVMVSTSGARLISDEALVALREQLIARATVITPNIPEASVLCGFDIASEQDMHRAAQTLVEEFGVAVLLKGGHGLEDANDLLIHPDASFQWFRSPRIETENTHGTGCTLSSAIACGLAKGYSLEQAVRSAKEYVYGALAQGLNLGKGSGPLHHFWEFVD